MVQQKFAGTHRDSLKKLQDLISQEAGVQKAIEMNEPGHSSATAIPTRTMGSPEWGNENPVNWRNALSLAGIAVADFDSSNTHHPLGLSLYHCMNCLFKPPQTQAMFFLKSILISLRREAVATIAREPNLEIVLTSLGSIWIVNRTSNKIDLDHGELFGFNTGVYAEINSGPGILKMFKRNKIQIQIQIKFVGDQYMSP